MTWAPAARQLMSLEQATASSAPVYPLGGDCGVQVWPPSVVARMDAPGPGVAEPTAVQCNASAQAIALKLVTVDGAYSTVHEAPPFIVPRMLGEFGPGSKSLVA
jgi:hypothetical protein